MILHTILVPKAFGAKPELNSRELSASDYEYIRDRHAQYGDTGIVTESVAIFVGGSLDEKTSIHVVVK